MWIGVVLMLNPNPDRRQNGKLDPDPDRHQTMTIHNTECKSG
jgi:hypothetical protein